ncbi:hypothetical protein KW823_21450 [Enterobacter quasiroggenkampii]|nr:hypothetical protein [Enterobacter quasiroggenkampii]
MAEDIIEYGIDRQLLKQLACKKCVKRIVLIGTATGNKIEYSAKVELKSSSASHFVASKTGERRVWAIADNAIDFLIKLGINEINVIFVKEARDE